MTPLEAMWSLCKHQLNAMTGCTFVHLARTFCAVATISSGLEVQFVGGFHTGVSDPKMKHTCFAVVWCFSLLSPLVLSLSLLRAWSLQEARCNGRARTLGHLLRRNPRRQSRRRARTLGRLHVCSTHKVDDLPAAYKNRSWTFRQSQI